MKFYCIINDKEQIANPDAHRLLKEAVVSRGLEWQIVEAYYYDSDSPKPEEGSVVYRQSISDTARLVEGLMVTGVKVRTLYRWPNAKFTSNSKWANTIMLQGGGVPVVPTFYGVNPLHTDKLAEYVDRLGGFPIILKATGGSHGASVMRLDSIQSLRSVLGFVATPGNAKFVLRKYIANARHIRLVVIGDQVVDAIEYLPVKDDFRTNNVSVPQVKSFQKDDKLNALAVQSAQLLGVEFGGVDVLIDESGTPFVAEINFPCNFARNQLNTGVDIASMLVDHVVAKEPA